MQAEVPSLAGPPAGGGGKRAGGIVGIGASAGGLEALRHFLGAVPADATQAFIVIQHLDPTRDALLPELLQAVTPLPVVEVSDDMPLLAGRVHVLPPNAELELHGDRLRLLPQGTERGHRTTIDDFFRSLADAAGERAVGVVLSGMGTDGTVGLRAIKAAGGGAFAQLPAEAGFPAMPASAVEAGGADDVAPAAELPARVAEYLARRPRADAAPAHATEPSIDEVLVALRRQTGHDFHDYKRGTLGRRIERRMALHRLDSAAAYAALLETSSGEAELLFRELLIGVTGFFRDPEVWSELRDEILPAMLRARPGGGTLRAWVAGCSTGEEAYTLAIVFREAVAAHAPTEPWEIRIFATDLDPEAIAAARVGRYSERQVDPLRPDRLVAHFVADGSAWRPRRHIRRSVVFAPQNVAMDPPFTRLDLLLCRNLLIYLAPALQQRVLPLFHFGLNPDGILVLGTAESVGTATALFDPLPGRTRLFRRRPLEGPLSLPPIPPALPRETAPLPQEVPSAAARAPSLELAAERLILDRLAPALVLVSGAGDILYVRGPVARYLAPAAGKANWTLAAMLRDGLRAPVVDALRQAVQSEAPVTVHDLAIEDDVGATVRVMLEPLDHPESLRGTVLVRFADEPGPAAVLPDDGPRDATDAIRRLRVELHAARDEASAVRTELQVANADLRASNEELQVANEELVSSQEELQSMNEELRTVNTELQAKLDELVQAGSDMANLLNSTDLATLFLDATLAIRRFTTSAATLFRVRAGDLGRPVTDLATELRYPELAEDARQVLRTLAPVEREVDTPDGRWFAVRVLPYRTPDDQPDGLVLTFSDVTRAKRLEAALAARLAARSDTP